ncbi:MAG: hypothetical protein ACNA7W_18385 [Pseudomonadales bacterium]
MALNENPPEDNDDADRKADVIAIMVIFSALVLAAVHFISGWAPQF